LINPNQRACKRGLLCLFLLTALPLAAQDMSDAEQALADGNPTRTAVLAQEKLTKYPNDFTALYLLSLAQSDLGQDEAAAQNASKAFDVALNDSERLLSARLAGGARFKLDQHFRAGWWLRVAANHAETPDDKAVVAQEFRQIQSANPLSVQASLSAAPSDNINNGADSDIIRLDGIDIDFTLSPETQALSGVEFAANVDLSYQITQSARHQTRVGAYLYGRSFALSSKAKQSVPDLRGSDYSLALAEVDLTHIRFLADWLGPTTVSLGFGHVIYSGDPLWDYAKLSLGQDIALGPSAVFSLQGSVQNQTARSSIVPDTKVYNLTSSLTARQQNGDLLQLSLTGILNDTELIESTFTDVSGTVGYSFASPVLGTQWSFFGTAGHTNYDEFSLSLDGRRDDYITFGSTTVFTEMSYFGFSPSVSFTATQRRSNVDPFNSTQVQGRFSIQSNF